MKVILYTTHCPRCKILEKKLQDKKIDYEEISDLDYLIQLGFKEVPIIELPNGIRYNFPDSIAWLKTL